MIVPRIYRLSLVVLYCKFVLHFALHSCHREKEWSSNAMQFIVYLILYCSRYHRYHCQKYLRLSIHWNLMLSVSIWFCLMQAFSALAADVFKLITLSTSGSWLMTMSSMSLQPILTIVFIILNYFNWRLCYDGSRPGVQSASLYDNFHKPGNYVIMTSLMMS